MFPYKALIGIHEGCQLDAILTKKGPVDTSFHLSFNNTG